MLFACSQPSTGTSNKPCTLTRSSICNKTFCNLTTYCLRDNFVPRPLRAWPLPVSSTGTISQSLSHVVPRPRVKPIKFAVRRQKARHTCLATGRISRLKQTGTAGRWLRQVAQPPFIAGPLWVIAHKP